MKVLALTVGLLFAPLLRAQTTVNIPYNGNMPVSITTSGCPGGATVTQPSPTHVNVDASKCQGGPPVLTVSCNPSSISTSQTSQCTASQPVTWKASSGSISASGLFTPSQTGSVTVTGSLLSDPSQSAQTTIQVNSVSACAGIHPTGGNDSANWSQVMDDAAASGKCVEIFAGSYSLGPNQNIPSNSKITCDSGVFAKATGAFNNTIWLDFGNSNITFTGPADKSCTFDMGAIPIVPSNQWRHILFLTGANNVHVSGVTFKHSVGDGCYISSADGVWLDNNTFDGAFRNACSMTDKAKNIHITNNEFAHAKGTNPEAGFDFEPNGGVPGNFFGPVEFVGNHVHDNNEDGVSLGLYAGLSSVSFTASGNFIDKSGMYGFFFNNSGDGNDSQGTATMNTLTVTNSGFGGAYGRRSTGGWQMVFNNLNVSSSNQRGNDPHYAMNNSIGVGINGGSAGRMGGVTYNNVTIQGGNGCMQMSGATNSTVSGTCNGKAIQYP